MTSATSKIIKCPACNQEVEAFLPGNGDGRTWALAGHYKGDTSVSGACSRITIPAPVEDDVVGIPEDWKAGPLRLDTQTGTPPAPPVTYGPQG